MLGYTVDQEFVLFTNIQNPTQYLTGSINYNLISATVTKQDLANRICPQGYIASFIKGHILQQMIDNGKIK